MFTKKRNGLNFGEYEMRIHPAIKIMLFIVFALALAINPFSSWMLAILLMIGVWVVVADLSTRKSFVLLKRLKWLYLSLFIVYAFFTPGELLLPWGYGPTFEGLEEAFVRILALMLIILAVGILLASMQQKDLVAGLYLLFLPLRYLGFEHEKFTVRVYLTLEKIAETTKENYLNAEIAHRLKPNESNPHGLTQQQKIAHFMDRLGNKFLSLMRQTSPVSHLEIDLPAAPRWFEWLLPGVLGLLFMVVAHYA